MFFELILKSLFIQVVVANILPLPFESSQKYVYSPEVSKDPSIQYQDILITPSMASIKDIGSQNSCDNSKTLLKILTQLLGILMTNLENRDVDVQLVDSILDLINKYIEKSSSHEHINTRRFLIAQSEFNNIKSNAERSFKDLTVNGLKYSDNYVENDKNVYQEACKAAFKKLIATAQYAYDHLSDLNICNNTNKASFDLNNIYNSRIVHLTGNDNIPLSNDYQRDEFVGQQNVAYVPDNSQKTEVIGHQYIPFKPNSYQKDLITTNQYISIPNDPKNVEFMGYQHIPFTPKNPQQNLIEDYQQEPLSVSNPRESQIYAQLHLLQKHLNYSANNKPPLFKNYDPELSYQVNLQNYPKQPNTQGDILVANLVKLIGNNSIYQDRNQYPLSDSFQVVAKKLPEQKVEGYGFILEPTHTNLHNIKPIDVQSNKQPNSEAMSVIPLVSKYLQKDPNLLSKVKEFGDETGPSNAIIGYSNTNSNQPEPTGKSDITNNNIKQLEMLLNVLKKRQSLELQNQKQPTQISSVNSGVLLSKTYVPTLQDFYKLKRVPHDLNLHTYVQNPASYNYKPKEIQTLFTRTSPPPESATQDIRPVPQNFKSLFKNKNMESNPLQQQVIEATRSPLLNEQKKISDPISWGIMNPNGNIKSQLEVSSPDFSDELEKDLIQNQESVFNNPGVLIDQQIQPVENNYHNVNEGKGDKIERPKQNLSKLSAITHQKPKLSLITNPLDSENAPKANYVELTYSLPQPLPVNYYYVVYKMPFVTFKNILKEKSALRSDPQLLHKELVSKAEVKVSPALEDIPKEEIANIVSSNGTIIDVKLVNDSKQNEKEINVLLPAKKDPVNDLLLNTQKVNSDEDFMNLMAKVQNLNSKMNSNNEDGYHHENLDTPTLVPQEVTTISSATVNISTANPRA